MSISFKIFKSSATPSRWLCGVGLLCLDVSIAPGRPIEFSEPSGTNLTAQVSSLGTKPADLPSIEDRVFKPHSFNSPDSPVYNMKPQTAPPPVVNARKNRTPGVFDRDNDWTQMAPEKILLKQMEREALKLPSLEAGDNLSDDASSWDPYNLKSSRRNGSGKKDSRGRDRETIRLDNASDVLTASDPFAPFSSRRSSSDNSPGADATAGRTRGLADLPHMGTEFSPEAVERKQQADHLEDFKRTLNFQTPGQSPVSPTPVYQPARGNAFVSEVDSFSRSSARFANPQLAIPLAPVAPRVPLAPGQTSLSPSPYSPPAKLKPVEASAPRRVF